MTVTLLHWYESTIGLHEPTNIYSENTRPFYAFRYIS